MLHERPLDTESPFVFLVGGSGTRRCEPLSYQAVVRGFARRLDRLGIRPEKTPHALRHTHATAMWEGGMRELALQKRLGHASPESIRIYTRVSDEQVLADYDHALGTGDDHVRRAPTSGTGRRLRRVHADRATTRPGSPALRQLRGALGPVDDYDRFVDRWPLLQDWFDAPLRQRLLDKDNAVRGQQPTVARAIMPYLSYLSLVHGVGLDYPVLLARTFTSPFKHQARHGGLGVDADLFDRHVVRLTELGYATARTQLVWPLGRMLLHRGDPDLTTLSVEDLEGLRTAITPSPPACAWIRCESSTPAHRSSGRPR